MTTLAKLDEIEREYEEWYGQLLSTSAKWLIDAAREAIALRALIEAHNAGCDEVCAERKQRSQSSCQAFARTSKGRCPDCPRLDRINLPALDAPAPGS